jgi:hypothetical protein
MKVWQSYYGGVVGIRSETDEEEDMLAEFLFLKKFELGNQVKFVPQSEFKEPQRPCPDCGFDGRHHS